MAIEDEDGVVTIRTNAGKRYVIPKSDVAMLEIDNTTAERLAEWFAGRTAAALAEAGASNVAEITVGIEEMSGQAGWFTVEV